MYASSFVGSLARMSELLDRTLDIKSYAQDRRALPLADEVLRVADDLCELIIVALEYVGPDGHALADGDSAVRTILEARLDRGFSADLDEETIIPALEADRVDRIDGTVIVPISGEMPEIRNWWVTVGFLLERLEDIRSGFSVSHRRAAADGSRPVETAYWTVLTRIDALTEVLEEARAYGRYAHARIDDEDLTLALGGLTHSLEDMA